MAPSHFDVFLSHNSKDKPAVERIAVLLKQAQIEPWLDAWQLTPGGQWQSELEAGLRASRSCAIFAGPHGVGDWVRMELAVALDLAAHNRDFRLFLVLLPGLPEPFDPTTLPAFLSTRTWVDLRGGFAEPAQLQPLINAIVGAPLGPSATIAPSDSECPYRGLETFTEEHAGFFFGREADVQRLLEKLKASRFLAVLGPSGSGKSSLVRAGLIPALRRGQLPGSEDWPIAVMRPGARPLTALAAQLVTLDPQRTMGSTLAELRGDAQALDLAVEKVLFEKQHSARLLLVVDQFEEVFTLCRDDAERTAFFHLLLQAATRPEGRCIIIVTLRADFYPRTAAYPELAALVAAHQALIGPLDEQGLRDAIVEPAWRVGLRFEDRLVDTILDDVGREPGSLPLLEHALLELWQRRRGELLTLEGYRASGGVRRAIATRADTVFTALPPDQQAVTRQILLRLTQPGEETEDTRRRANLEELITRPQERPAVEAAIEALVAARLLTTSQDEASGAVQVDVAHEALIRGWPRLRQWVEEDRQGLIVHRRLTEAAHEWRESGHDPDLLYRGVRLEEARALAARQPAALNESEQQFLAESEALRERERQARERLRRRIMVGSILAALVSLLFAAFAGWQWQEARHQSSLAITAESTALAETDRAETAAAAAQTAEAERALREQAATEARATAEVEALRAQTEARVALSRQLAAQAHTLTDDLDLGLLLAAEAYDLNPDDFDVRRSLLAVTDALPQLARILPGHGGAVRTLAFSPDGQVLASGGDDDTVRFWQPLTGKEADPAITTDHSVWDLSFSPDEELAIANVSVLQLWNAATGFGPTITADDGSFIQTAFSPDGSLLASATEQGTIALWDPASGQAIGPAWSAHEGEVTSLAFTPDGRTLVSSGYLDGTIRFWDVTGQRANRLQGQPIATEQGAVQDTALSPDGSVLATAGQDGTIRLWDTKRRLPIGAPLTGHESAVYALAFSPDGTVLYSAGEDGTIRKWEVAAHRPLGEPVETGQGVILMLAISPDGATLASGGSDGSIRLWRVAPKRALFAALDGLRARPIAMAYSPDGNVVATSGADGSIILWDTDTDSQIGLPLRGHAAPVWALAFSPDGKTLASVSDDGTGRLWRPATGSTPSVPLLGHTGPVYAVAFSPTGDLLATAGQDGTVRRWRSSDGMPVGDPLVASDPHAQFMSVSFNPQGSALAASDSDGATYLWDAESAKPMLDTPIATAQGITLDVCFVRGGTQLATAGQDGTIRYWNARDGSALGAPVVAHEGAVERLVCSQDGMSLATSGDDGRILLWQPGATKPSAEPLGNNEYGWQPIAFNQPGSRLAFTSTDPNRQFTLDFWDIDGGELAEDMPITSVLTAAVLSGDGSRVVAAGTDGRVRVWDAHTGMLLSEQRTPDGEGIVSVAISPDGARIALGGTKGAVRLWDGTSRSSLSAPLGHHGDWVLALAFSPDGTFLASGANEGTVRIWNVATQQAGGEFIFDDAITAQGTSVVSLSFDRSGSMLAVGGSRTIRFWDIAREALRGDALRPNSGVVTALAFSPSGQELVSGNDAGAIQVWDVASRQPVAERRSDAPDTVTTLVLNDDGSHLAAGMSSGDVVVWDTANWGLLGRLDLEIGSTQALVFALDGLSLVALGDTGAVSQWSLSPADWRQRACTIAGRNLTWQEWKQYVGDPDDPNLPYHAICPDLPLPTVDETATPVASNPTESVLVPSISTT